VLTDHVAVGMPHLFGNPVDRRYPCGKQLTGVRVPALTWSTIANPGRKQVGLEKPVPHHEVADVRQAAFRSKIEKLEKVVKDETMKKMIRRSRPFRKSNK
jgi:hypothetical protein